MIEGIFSGEIDKRPCTSGCPPPTFEMTTYVQSVDASDGFNVNGTNMATYLNVAVAQAKSTKGYILDNSFFTMYIANNGSSCCGGTAGTGTYTLATSACNLENPVGYGLDPVLGHAGTVSNRLLVVLTPFLVTRAP
jgi:hypothetical protein